MKSITLSKLEKSNSLIFEDSKNRQLLDKWLLKVNPEIVDLLFQILITLNDQKPPYLIKVVSLSTKPGFHFGRDFNDWDVIAWIDPCLKWLNLRLKHGTQAEDLWKDVSYHSRNSTPHTVCIKHINSIKDIDKLIELFLRLERQY